MIRPYTDDRTWVLRQSTKPLRQLPGGLILCRRLPSEVRTSRLYASQRRWRWRPTGTRPTGTDRTFPISSRQTRILPACCHRGPRPASLPSAPPVAGRASSPIPARIRGCPTAVPCACCAGWPPLPPRRRGSETQPRTPGSTRHHEYSGSITRKFSGNLRSVPRVPRHPSVPPDGR